MPQSSSHRAVDLMDAKTSEAARRSRARCKRAAVGGLRPLTVSPLRKQDASMRSMALPVELGAPMAKIAILIHTPHPSA